LTTAGFSTEKEIFMANKKSFFPLLVRWEASCFAFGAYFFKIPTHVKISIILYQTKKELGTNIKVF
jgi:hypothetical protein